MKINSKWFILLLCMPLYTMLGQQTKLLTLKEAVELAIQNSNATSLAKTKVETSKLDVETVKNNQYPNLKASGQYLRLTNAHIASNLSLGGNSSNGNSSAGPLKIEQLMIGQVNASMPIFSGFKLKNSIKSSEQLYQSEKYSEKHTQEQIGLEVVDLFASLYKAEQTKTLIADNLKTIKQRVLDFTDLEQNGLIARNDLLKVQLQEATVQLALDNAQKNVSITNHKLVSLLKLPENTKIEIDIEAIKKEMVSNQSISNTGERNDVKSLELKKTAAETGVKIVKSNYYPSLAFTGGYIAFDLTNVLTVTNAMNYGIGVSYDLANIFKNKKQVQLAENKAKETKIALDLLQEQINEEIFQAQENYNLSIKQSSVYEKAVVQATENYRIVKDKYDNTLATTTELLDADYEQLQAKINQALSKADVAQKYYELQYASGKLINSLTINQK